MSKLFIIMGKSSTGKDTIYKKLKERNDLSLKTVIPYTTRPIRQNETDEVEYFFVKTDYLEQLRQDKKVIEERSYHTIHGIWYYFTADDGQIHLENNNYLMITTLEGYEKIRKRFGESNVIPIYIEVEDGLRLKRALTRETEQIQPKYAEMCRRFLADEKDFSEKRLDQLKIRKKYQNICVFDCLEQIIDDIRKNI